MIKYTRYEMIGTTKLSKSLNKYLNKLASNSLTKIVILKKNKPEAVIVSIDEYEYIKKASELLKNQTDLKRIES